MNDRQFFATYTRRQARIRAPEPGEAMDKFETLGGHDERRRCMLVVRVNRQIRRVLNSEFMFIPFLAFNDETIENRDDVLLPLLKELLDDAAKREPSPRLRDRSLAIERRYEGVGDLALSLIRNMP